MSSDEELKEDVKMLKYGMWGNPMDPDMPGLFVGQKIQKMEQERTNEILTELRNAVIRINWMLISGFFLALFALVFKAFSGVS